MTEVGDAWLDAGIVPFSTLGWESPEWVPHGNGTGAAAGLTGADLPDHAYWEKWFPADWVSEMREQIRLWFYSISFMAVTLTGRSPYRSVLTYEKLLDEHGREMHRSWGNAIPADEAFDRMGADVMRWQFCEQNPSQNLRFGYGPANEVKRRILTLWHSASFLVTYANVEEFRPRWEDVSSAPAGASSSRSTAGCWPACRSSSPSARPATRSPGRRGWRARSRPSSTISRTGTSAARARASGAATRPRCGRSGSRSSRCCA